MSERASENRRHPDIFTPEEAAEYLHLDSVRSLDTLRAEYGLIGHRGLGQGFLYSREDLDNAWLAYIGKRPLAQAKARPMRIAK